MNADNLQHTLLRPTGNAAPGGNPSESGRASTGTHPSFDQFLVEDNAEIGGKNTGSGLDLASAATPDPELAFENGPSEHPRHARYTADVVIGESAVAFQSRSIVAPGSFNHRSDVAVPPLEELRAIAGRSESSLSLDPLTLADWSKFAEPGIGTGGKEWMASFSSIRAGSIRSGTSQLAPNRLPLNATVQPAVWAAAIAVPSSAATDNSAPNIAERTSPRPLPPVPIHGLQSASLTVAQLIATPSEYRIIVRGQVLSSAERDQLIEDMNLSLAQFGLPFQPVQFVFPEREP